MPETPNPADTPADAEATAQAKAAKIAAAKAASAAKLAAKAALAANGTPPAATTEEAKAVAVAAKPTAAPAVASDEKKAERYEFPKWWKDWAGLSRDDKILGAIRTCAIFVLIGIPIFLFSYHPDYDKQPLYEPQKWLHISWTSGRFVWTLVIAILPLCIILMGFYRWRQICPLAWFGRMSEWVGYPDKRTTPAKERRRRTVPEWLVKNYPAFTWGFLAFMLAMRILLINSNSVALAWAFIGLCALAAAVSFRYVGKSWCNYLCPVSTIQRIYMETDRPNYPDNSQCPTCSGCKTVPTKGRCPDINSENDYWQEVKNPSRAWAYYAWPGTVLGFYTWYFLHKPYYGHRLFPTLLNANITQIRNFDVVSEAHKFGVEMQKLQGHWVTVPSPGTTGVDWAYYMSGDWTRNPAPWTEWFGPGWGFTGNLAFTGWIPTILSAPLTLVLFSLVSYGIFRGAEVLWLAYLKKRGLSDDEALEAVRHSLFCIAGFTSFMLFYTFAGAPTFRQLPLQLYSLFYIGVSVAATSVLFTRLRRTREKAANDKQARDWIDRWPSGIRQIPLQNKTMEEAYNLITLEVRTSENGRGIFKDTVRNMLVDNALTLDEVDLLNKMAKDLGLSESDQKKVITELSKDLPEIFDPKLKMSLGDRLRLIGYRSDLEQAMSAAGGALPSGAALKKMQEMFRVQEAEHQEILRDLRNPQGTRAARLREEVSQLFALRRKTAVLAQHTDPAICFLELELRRRIRDDRDHILEVANLYGPAEELSGLRELIQQNVGFDSKNEGDENSAAQKALEQTETWLAAHLPIELAGDVIQAVCAAGDALPSMTKSSDELAEAILPFIADTDPLIRGAAIHALRVPLQSADMSDNLRQTARNAAASAAFDDPLPLVQNAGVVALAPNLWTPDEFVRLLESSHPEVRRAAVNHLPMPPPPQVKAQLGKIAQGSDASEVRVLAAALSGEVPRLPRGHLFADLTALERIFALTNANSLLESLPREDLITLAQNAGEEIFADGETLCHEGEIEDVVYFLVNGQTEAVQMSEDGTTRRLGISEAGETVGEMAVLDPAPRSASVRAINGSVRVLAVSGEAFRNVLRRDPKVTLGLVRLVIRRGRQSAASSRPLVAPAAPVLVGGPVAEMVEA